MPPVIHLVPHLGAILVVARYRTTGRVVVLVDQAESWRTIVNIVRVLLLREQRREVYRELLSH
jgi:hypothetical protein